MQDDTALDTWYERTVKERSHAAAKAAAQLAHQQASRTRGPSGAIPTYAPAAG